MEQCEKLRAWARQEIQQNRQDEQPASIAALLDSVCRFGIIPQTAGKYYKLDYLIQYATEKANTTFTGHRRTANARRRHWAQIKEMLQKIERKQAKEIL